MNKLIYLGTLIGITTVLVVLGMAGSTTHVLADSPTDTSVSTPESGQIGHHEYVGESGEIEKCEGMVYESAEDALAAAIENGCEGYHEFEKDGKVWYMADC